MAHQVTKSQKDLIDMVSADTGAYKKDLRIIMESIENNVIKILSEADYDSPVEFRLFQGFYISAERQPARAAVDPRTQEPIEAREKIKIKPNITKAFRWRIQGEAGLFDGYEPKPYKKKIGKRNR